MSTTLERHLDPARTEAFAGRLLATYTDSVVTLLTDLGFRTGLLETLAAGSGTSRELAERAGLAERYVRECLGGLVTAGIVDYSPATATYADRLAAGGRVGCGTGLAVNLLARAYPRADVTGYDIAADAIRRARAEAAAWGLANGSFGVCDATRVPTAPPLAAVFAFDAIHDQGDPAGVLRRIHDALEPGGVFAMLDIKAASALEDNVGNPLAPWLYGVSTLHCLPVSLAEGGTGLDAVWGEQRARQMLGEAGFSRVTVQDVPDDPLDSLYVALKPA